MQVNNNRSSLLIGLVVFVLVAGAAAYILTRDQAEPATNSSQNQPDQGTTPGNENADPTDVTIEFGDDGFKSSTYTVAPGATVTVRNNSSQSLQFSSNDHPTHRNNPELNTPAIGPGQTTTFTAPTEPGEYGFHDHIDDRYVGAIIVQ